MKNPLLLMILMFSSSFFFNTKAQTESTHELETIKVDISTGEKIFIENADKCLALMEQEANKMSVEGVAVVAFIPGNDTKSWVSKMIVVGTFSSAKDNLLAIAYSKISEMADTYKNSGSKVREPKKGEFGWQGGIIKKVHSGYILAAFSGASGEQDVKVSNAGLDWLNKQY